MNVIYSLSDVNWGSVLLATVLAFALGSLWYSPVLFGKTWMQELNIVKDETKKVNMPMIFGLAFLLNFISAIFLDALIGTQSSLFSGLLVGFIVSIVFVATALGINYLFSQKSRKLFLIDAGYFVVFYSLMGAILGAW